MSCEIKDISIAPTYWTEQDRHLLLEGLEDSRNELIDLITPLDDAAWHFRMTDSSWTIAEIVEHIGLQQDMHYREVYVLSKAPPHPEFVSMTSGNDIKILNYESDTTKGEATWNVVPLGRWCSKNEAISQFNFSRDKFVEFVKNTNADLKQHFTFRTLADKTDYRNIRDLHQIVLTTITHTRRHVHQIEEIIQQL